MASDKGYLEFILEQLSLCEGIEYRYMMGEYVLYCKGKVFGGIYDNRFLVKNTLSARGKTGDYTLELPYEKGTPMILVDNIDDRLFLKDLVEGMYDEIPAPKRKR